LGALSTLGIAGGYAIRRGLLALIPGGEVEPESENHTIFVCIGSRSLDGPTTCRTHLLAFQPTLQAAEVKDMTAGELLWAGALDLSRVCRVPRVHLFSADNTSIFAAQLLGRRIGV
jgi:hypothetical protein